MSIFPTTCPVREEKICDLVYDNFLHSYKIYIHYIEIISLILFFLLMIYLILNKYKFKKKITKIKKITYIFLSIFLLFLTFLYTFISFLFPANYIDSNCRIIKNYNCYNISDRPIIHKPIIYLYPEQETQIKVELEVAGELIADYPRYDEKIGGWEVLAYPDGTLIDNSKEYSYLFWEAIFENNDWDLNRGFIVEGKDAREFLEEKLSYIGLTPREYNEFIVYWYPLMMNNKYNLVYFAGLDYTEKAPLKIIPEPDSILRVFTVIKPLEDKIYLPEQKLEVFDRKGFTVVEWGGTILEK